MSDLVMLYVLGGGFFVGHFAPKRDHRPKHVQIIDAATLFVFWLPILAYGFLKGVFRG